MFLKGKGIVIAGAVGLMLMLAAACAGDSSDDSAAAPQQPAAASQPDPAAAAADPSAAVATESGATSTTMATEPQPKSGGILTQNTPVDPWDFDMTYVGKSFPNSWAQALAYEPLLRLRYAPDVAPDSATVEASLAESWEINDDSTTYTFKIRPGVKWANMAPLNGRALVSDDVKWSYEYASRTGQFADADLPKAQFSYMFAGLESVEAPDPSTVVVNFGSPFSTFFNYAASGFNPILPHEIYDEDGTLQGRIVGTGPFQLDTDKIRPGSRWEYTKNPDYWEEGLPRLDAVRWLVIKDSSSAGAAFKAGQLDIFTNTGLDGPAATRFRQDNPDATMYRTSGSPTIWYLNSRRPPLDDARVRKAFDLGINRQELIDVLFDGGGTLALPGVYPGVFEEAEIQRRLKYDPEEARRLLTDAGFPNGFDIEFQNRANNTPQANTLSVLLQSQLAKVGIRLQINVLEKSVESKNSKTGSFFLAQPRGKSFQGDPEGYYSIFHSASKSNYMGLNDPQLDQMIESVWADPDPIRRRETLRNLVRRVHDNSYFIALYYGEGFSFAKNDVEGFYGPYFGVVGHVHRTSWLNK